MYQEQNFEHLLGLNGFSDALLKNHFTLYQGYIKNTNKLLELSEKLEAGSPEFAECKRRFAWEWNGMRLHELYFGNLTKNAGELSVESELFQQISKDFGSFENWQKDFKNIGTMRGIGWVLLVFDPVLKKLFNLWINEHDMGHLAGVKPVLVMDVFEHAFMVDYGLKKADYIETFFKAIDWQEAQKRLNQV